jgi:tetrahydromethanopterin S-methyltransferase subunit A
MNFTPDDIRNLNENEIFVFGSNTQGRHSKGAALTAQRKFGAKYGVGEGITGKTYALPTVGNNLSKMSVETIRKHVNRFLRCAAENPDKIFLVTLVGCGLAGHKVRDIGPMFKERTENVILPKQFWDEINKSK